MANEWRDYTGGPIPVGTTHVQRASGDVADYAPGVTDLFGDIIRYYGPDVAPAPDVVPPIYPQDYAAVVQRCAAAILAGERVAFTHPAGYSRCDMDIPDVKGPDLTHEYSPLKLLKWIAAQVPKAY
ncbi:hypothetical protein FBF48_10355 [Streptococcus salivarius]|uniref:Uncharacterized protein n=1 Tax=Streptococcus salivarius TaxID=1304 RepID=A0AAX2UZX4_STRSL|nr:hypothetical protein [Streptococcus salivarius]TNF65664.1 hypothetical protein FBF48_10355 [Streptococcus salivarius]